MGQGATYNYLPGITPQYGFSGNVTFSVTGLPAGVTALWNPNPTTSGTNLTLISSSSAPAGTHNLTITGTSGNITSSITVPLTIHAPSFTLYTPNQVSIGQGTTTTSYLSINALYGFNGNVTLSASGLPNGVTASFSPNPTTNSTTLTLTATSTATVGTSTVTITGTSGTLTASATLTLGVYAPTFTISGGGSVSVGQGTTTTAYFNVYSQYGFNGAVNFSVSGVPAGVTASFAPNPTSNSTTLTLTAAQHCGHRAIDPYHHRHFRVAVGHHHSPAERCGDLLYARVRRRNRHPGKFHDEFSLDLSAIRIQRECEPVHLRVAKWRYSLVLAQSGAGLWNCLQHGQHTHTHRRQHRAHRSVHGDHHRNVGFTHRNHHFLFRRLRSHVHAG